MRHFLDLKDFNKDALEAMLQDGLAMRKALKSGEQHAQPLAGKHIGMILKNNQPEQECHLKLASASLAAHLSCYLLVICKLVAEKVFLIQPRYYQDILMAL